MKKSMLMFASTTVLLATGNLIGGLAGTSLILAALLTAVASLVIALRQIR